MFKELEKHKFIKKLTLTFSVFPQEIIIVNFHTIKQIENSFSLQSYFISTIFKNNILKLYDTKNIINVFQMIDEPSFKLPTHGHNN